MAGSEDNAAKRSRIAQLNDYLRTTFRGGKVYQTAGVSALPTNVQDTAAVLLRTFTAFTADNDPHGEHDFGSFEIGQQEFFWKIDYYAPDMEHGSDDPIDPAKTVRVLTLLLAEEPCRCACAWSARCRPA